MRSEGRGPRLQHDANVKRCTRGTPPASHLTPPFPPTYSYSTQARRAARKAREAELKAIEDEEEAARAAEEKQSPNTRRNRKLLTLSPRFSFGRKSSRDRADSKG